jgi:hypothetical protein
MKYILLFSLLFQINLSFAQEHENDASKDKVVITETIDGANVYGNKWNSEFDKLDIEKAINEHEMLIGEEMIFSGNITKVCQKRGCWMMLETNGKYARVDFNHHSFFIPKDTQGSAEVFGVLHSKTMSDEMKKHLESEGAGKLAEKIFEITATSVKIKS